jgi:hypothetical protein
MWQGLVAGGVGVALVLDRLKQTVFENADEDPGESDTVSARVAPLPEFVTANVSEAVVPEAMIP